ncbi:stage II sporulation protein M [Sphingomonas aerophila]|uniref:Putative membrane protein SpoIIM required for sporulation n=1 Tax=Sphingomonas aerophila TaxID=1344948 RepID=A0A7W9EVF0_9SPHN|nr:putative membrane protein SpoIIM required for sporulation [Sphingomonas aerophila]
MSALVDAAGAAPVNASRFRAAHGAEWEQLERLVTSIERRSVRALSDEDLIALPLLYRATLSSLSVARETSLDRALITYLEQLSTRAYFQIYGVQSSLGSQLGRFFARGWPDAVRALWRETLVVVLFTIAGAFVAYLLVRSDPSWFYALLPEGLANGRDPAASADSLRESLYASDQNMLATFAAYLFQNNAQVAIFSFALGFALGIPTILLILYNGLMLGAFFAVFVPKGLGPNFTCWLAIHGTTELFAIFIAGAAGLRIGGAIAFPGRIARVDAAVAAGRSAATAMAGTVVMLAVAGLLEGIGRQTVTNDGLRLLIGLAMLSGWLAYFYLPRKRHALALA